MARKKQSAPKRGGPRVKATAEEADLASEPPPAKRPRKALATLRLPLSSKPPGCVVLGVVGTAEKLSTAKSASFPSADEPAFLDEGDAFETSTPRAVITALCALCASSLAALVADGCEASAVLLDAAFSARDAAAPDASAPLRVVLTHFAADAGATTSSPPLPLEASSLYAALRHAPGAPPPEETIPGLVPTLRGFQRSAVAFMLRRERCEAPPPAPGGAAAPLHPLWARLGEGRFASAAAGELSRSAPPPDDGPRGGLLCDQMGLGKTVELLALILSNRWSPPAAAAAAAASSAEGSPLLPCGATLVVCPSPIAAQWASEARAERCRSHGDALVSLTQSVADHEARREGRAEGAPVRRRVAGCEADERLQAGFV